MEKIIIGDFNPFETRIAILENGIPTQLFYERSLDHKIVGNIYMGKVMNVLPGMQTAFVDIGIGKDVFLQVGDMDFDLDEHESIKDVKIQNYLRVGDNIPTQIIKDAVGNKGPRASTCIALPGRYAVLVPSLKQVGISKKIANDKERQRLSRLAREMVPEGVGIIIRTLAEGVLDSELRGEIKFLLREWEKVAKLQKTAKERTLIHPELSLSMKIVRDYFTDEVSKFVLNSKDEFNRILNECDFLSPFQRASLEHYGGEAPIFEKFDIERSLATTLQPKVWLDSGGYIIIQDTEALVSIDINTGKFTGKNNLATTVYQTNLTAIKEIARQIRLRNLAGIIIIDFIDMQSEAHKRDVVGKLRQEFDKDPVKTQIFELTDLGLVQMTRHRTGKSLGSILRESCPYCEGRGNVFNKETTTCKVLSELNRIMPKTQAKRIKVELHPTVGDFININYRAILDDMMKRFDKKIKIVQNNRLHYENYYIITL